MPYYKWSFRGLEGLPILGDLTGDLEYLISSGNSTDEANKKRELIESICGKISDELRLLGLTEKEGTELEPQAYAVNEKITDHGIRTLHILYGV